jgi:hypothetical protein
VYVWMFVCVSVWVCGCEDLARFLRAVVMLSLLTSLQWDDADLNCSNAVFSQSASVAL